MIDLHNHLLPGIDDGSRSAGESVRHLRALARDGTALVVLTPHLLIPDLPGAALQEELCRQKARYDVLRHRLAEQRGLPGLRLGQEVLAPFPAHADRILDAGGVGLAGSRAVLVEFGFGPDHDAPGVIRRLVEGGRLPLVAHVERYDFGDRNPLDEIARWRDLGAVIQVNVGSLLGRYPDPARSLGWQVVRSGLAHVIASDHHGDARPHAPALVLSRLHQDVGPEVAARLLGGNAARLLRDDHALDAVPAPRPGHAVA